MSAQRLACLLIACAPLLGARAAAPIYKCQAADGAVSYQDHPCPAGTDQPAPRIAPPPPFVPLPEQAPAARGPERKRGDFSPVSEPAPPLPVLFRCYDGVTGKGYVSDTPQQNLRYVPLWTVMPSGSTVGGLSAGIRPPDPAETAALANYTEVQDRCHEMSVGELCGYWRGHVGEVHAKRRVAFKDTRAALEQEEADLTGNLASHCGR